MTIICGLESESRTHRTSATPIDAFNPDDWIRSTFNIVENEKCLVSRIFHMFVAEYRNY